MAVVINPFVAAIEYAVENLPAGLAMGSTATDWSSNIDVHVGGEKIMRVCVCVCVAFIDRSCHTLFYSTPFHFILHSRASLAHVHTHTYTHTQEEAAKGKWPIVYVTPEKLQPFLRLVADQHIYGS